MAEVTGGIGSAPPPGAPNEVSQPLDMDAQMAELARRQALNLAHGKGAEGELKPFDPKPEDQIQPPSPSTETASSAPVDPNAAEKLLEAVRAQQSERSHQPAASDSDSPSRGIPKPITDPGKVITGGFGTIGEAQYYAINGYELAALVRGEMDKMSTRIENDLRFSMALTYPRISVRLVLEVTSYAQNEGITLEYVKVPEKQTPIEIAKQHADEVCFVLIERRQEFNAQGEPEDPPDRIRESLDLPVPRKQIIHGGAGTQVVDIVPDIQESF